MFSSIDYNLYINIIFLMTVGKYHRGNLGDGYENIDRSEVKASKVILQIYGKQTRNR